MADLNINEVIKDGEVLLSTRGTTVAPENLASGETAIDHEGNMIVGMMPTVDISDLYRVPDDEGTPANEDYIPFNDVSDEEEPTKKVSYEDIKEDILKDTYQTTDTAGTDIADDDYFPYQDISDSTTPTKKTLFSNLVSKLTAKFQSLFPYLSQPTRLITANTDLNDYTDSGTYQCNHPNVANSLSNCPVGTSFKLIVDRAYLLADSEITQKIVCQNSNFATDWIRTKTYGTTTWGDWQQINVSFQNTFNTLNYRRGSLWTQIKHSIATGGDKHLYHNFSTDNGTTWNGDIEIIDKASIQTYAHYLSQPTNQITANQDLNDYTNSGTYQCNNGNIAITLSNCPVSCSFKLIVDRAYTRTESELTQRITCQNDKESMDWYRTRQYNSSTWSDWKQIAITSDFYALKSGLYNSLIQTNDDLNNYTTAGTYDCKSSSITQTLSNCPVNEAFKMMVDVESNPNILTQTITVIHDKNAMPWRRSRDNSLVWGDWKQFASTDDISPSTMGNGYAVTTVSGSTITATITGYKLRAGAIVALMFNSFIKVACTLNISNTGAKNIQMITGGNPSEGTPLPIGVNTFIYDGTYYRFLSNNMSPYISTQSYVASTSGNIILNWGFANDSVQLKHYISTGRLVYNYYKNGAWREDKQILDITGQQTLERWLGLKSPANTRTIASGAHNLAVQDTIPNILGELRYSNGAWGSFNLGTAYTYRDLIVPTGWYNYFYMPHRVGGENWTTPTNWDTDNVNYGTLMLFGMNNDNGIYRIRWSSSAIVLVERLDSMAVSVTKTGKSILPSWYYSTNVREIEGVTYTFNPQTCEITANGTATSDSWCVLYFGDENMYSRLQRGSYVLSGCASGGSIDTYFVALYVTGNDWKDYGNGVSFTIPNEAKLTKNYAIVVKKNATVSNLVFKPMLRPAWTSAEFEPCEDIHKGNCYVGTCETAGGTKDKAAYVDGYFILRKGVRVAIKFTNSNTYSSSTSNPITLNVNNTGAKNIYAYNTHSGAGLTGTNNFVYGIANQYNYFIYDGTYWCFDGHGGDYDTTNFLRNDASSTMTASSPYLVLKASNVDAKQANNGVSATVYSSYALSDKNNYALSRLESIAETNGNTRTYLQVGNYKTSTSSTFNMGITLYANKSGDMWYNFSNPYNASSALGFGYGTCDTAESTVAKVVTLSRYIIAKNGYVTVKFTNAVPANSTMNINSQGAKNIYYHGSAITAGRIRAGDYATFIFDGTNYNLIGVDRETERILTASLSANATTVTFTGLPTSGNQMYDIYTDKPNLTYTNIDNSTSGQITITFPAQTTATNVYLKISDL